MATRKSRNPKRLDIEGRLTGQQRASHTSFVEVAQPGYQWFEVEAPSSSTGFTAFPKGRAKNRAAAYVAPTLNDTEEGRLIRVHELLHARLTPNVDKVAQAAQRKGLSNVSVQYAEDHRINAVGAKLGLFTKLNASIDEEAASEFVVGLCKQGAAVSTREAEPDIKYARGLTTGKIVQSAIALSGYPCNGFNPTDVSWIVRAALGSSGGAFEPTVRCDAERAQAIVNDFIAARDEALARTRKGKNTDRALLAELIRLVEIKLVEAYAAETEKTEPPQPDLPGVDDPNKNAGAPDENAGEGASAGGGEESSDADGQNGEGSAESAPGDGSDAAGAPGSSEGKAQGKPKKKTEDELLEEEFADVEAKFEDIHVSGVGYDPVLGINKRDAETPQKALRNRATTKAIDNARKAREKKDIEDKLAKGAILTDAPVTGSGSDGGVIAPPSHSEPQSDDNLTLSLTRSEWAPLHIQLAPLSRSKKNLAPRLGRAGVDGATPKHFSRWFSDRSILEVKGRRPGGALLVDVSGSMSWSAEQTQRLVDEAPALTVALYSSAEHLKEGLLTIIARNGRVIADGFSYREAAFRYRDGKFGWDRKEIPNLRPHGGGNVCDGPALLWLSRQPGPRVWYCDGNVSGKGDSFTLPLTVEAFRLAYLSQVTRTTDYDTCLALLRGTAKPNPVQAHHFQALLDASKKRYAVTSDQVQGLIENTKTINRGTSGPPKAGKK